MLLPLSLRDLDRAVSRPERRRAKRSTENRRSLARGQRSEDHPGDDAPKRGNASHGQSEAGTESRPALATWLDVT